MNGRCNTYLVDTSEGIYGSADVSRVPDNEAYDVDLLQAIGIRYYDFLDDGIKQPPAVIAARTLPAAANPESSPIVPAGGGYAPRRFRITKSDLERFGFTGGCPGCISAQTNDWVRLEDTLRTTVSALRGC